MTAGHDLGAPRIESATGQQPPKSQVNNTAPYLNDEHTRELLLASRIDPDVVAERRYESVMRPSNADNRPRERLARLKIPSWAIREDSSFPGLLIPIWSVSGERVSCQWKPRVPVTVKGKPQKYASQRGQTSRLDVHPRNRAALVDPTVPLWITEGVKKGDALTSQGRCVISLTGVFNWRNTYGTLGDWEDVQLKGRTVTVCFDSDAWSKPNVLRAMVRLGEWLKSRQVKAVRYLITPGEVGGMPVKGADDYLAAGGTIESLEEAATTTPPNPDTTVDTYTDARLAETIADEVLTGCFHWVGGVGWQAWDGRRWADASPETVGEAVRQYSLARFRRAVEVFKADPNAGAAVEGWHSMLSAAKERAVLGLARGIVEVRAADLDRDPDLLNTPSGVVDLATGELLAHDPALLMTKLTGPGYDPAATHPDWVAALCAVPPDVRDWLQVRLGQAATGYMTSDDQLLICQGGGENGKTTVFEGLAKALGDYEVLLSERALLANPDAHPTELMDLRGARLALLEETPEARRLDPQRLKRTVGSPNITARRMRKDPVTFPATHSLVIATNHKPIVAESDTGTWRRLQLVLFPYRYRKPHEPIEGPDDRRGDPTLRERCRTDPAVHAAALAWLVEGAKRWYAAGRVLPGPPRRVADDMTAWRAEADPIVAYASDRLVFDPERHVMSSDLLRDMNDWLRDRENRVWTAPLLASRFGEHEMAKQHRVEKKKIRRSGALSRPIPGSFLPGAFPTYPAGNSVVPATYAAWLGVRFATAADREAEAVTIAPEGGAQTITATANVPGVPAESYDQNIAHIGRNGFLPEHPEHPRSEGVPPSREEFQRYGAQLREALPTTTTER